MCKIIALFALMLLLSYSSYLTNIEVYAGTRLSTMVGHNQEDWWGRHNSRDPSGKNLSDPNGYGRR